MSFEQWLGFASEKLEKNGIDSFRLDAIMLLEAATKKDRSYIFAYPETKLTESDLSNLEKTLQKRIDGQPMAYILGRKEFYGRQFKINKNVLIPRPESEAMIDLLKKYCRPNMKTLIDVGTGSGCLAITAKIELPNLKVEACDISDKSLVIAAENAKNLNAKITFFKSDLLEAASKKYDIVIANLPYVPDELNVSRDVTAEPKTAVFAPDNGLFFIKKLFLQLPNHLSVNGLVITESLMFQHDEIIKLARQYGLKHIETNGLAQVFSIV